MKILLVGEYSRLHNSLKEGLVLLGHEVVLVGDGDYFKNYPVDIKLKRRFQKGLGRRLKNLLFLISGFDLSSWLMCRSFFSHKGHFKNFDVVQLINESPLGISPKYERRIIDWLKKHNKKLFVLACGTDHISVQYAMDKHFRYSIMEPLFLGKVSEKDYAPILKYLKQEYRDLHKWVMNHCDGYIASDMDYHLPYRELSKYLGMIPNPINVDRFEHKAQKTDDIPIIFHGVNRKNYHKKGGDYFDQALDIVQAKRPDECRIVRTADLPYHKYIEALKESDIVLDQVLGYDQGYNALEAMAQGKVLLTCAEKEWREHYDIPEDAVALNALPDADKIAHLLIEIIDQPERRKKLGQQAREFVEQHHHYREISQRYLKTWGC
jgi:glycosyltransferase involved in cell wall biosynthesis